MSTNTKIYKARSIQKALADIKEELGSDAIIVATRRIPKSPRDPYSDDMFEIEAAPNDEIASPLPEEKLNSHAPASLSRSEENPYCDTSIINELTNIKDLISLVGFGSGMESILCNHTESAGILASLLRSGISEKRTHLILQRASIAMESDLSRHRGIVQPLKKYVIRECMKDIHTRDIFARPLDSGMPHIAAFVGPTGVGKTTTIAKLAADLSILQQI